jgi:hypothetical protein
MAIRLCNERGRDLWLKTAEGKFLTAGHVASGQPNFTTVLRTADDGPGYNLLVLDDVVGVSIAYQYRESRVITVGEES